MSVEDFGANPKSVLLALKTLPAYCGYAPAALLALTKQTPIIVLEDCVSQSLAEHIEKMFRDCGASVLTRLKVLG